MNIFLITSAINTPHGVFKMDERVAQTISTIESIKERTNADILILDGSPEDIPKEISDELLLHVNGIAPFTHAKTIQDIHKSKSQDVVKNGCEILMFGTFITMQLDMLSKYDRIFKISGRYRLNADFNIDEHMAQTEHVVVGKQRFSQFNDKITGGINKQYMSRLISFPSSKLEFMSQTYAKIFQHFIDRLSEGGYVDIEHLLWYYLHDGHAHELPFIGVEGELAPNGNKIAD